MKAALHEVMYAETREHAREAVTRFATEYGPKYPKAVTTLEKDADALLTFFIVRAGIVFVHGVQQEGKANKTRPRAA